MYIFSAIQVYITVIDYLLALLAMGLFVFLQVINNKV